MYLGQWEYCNFWYWNYEVPEILALPSTLKLKMILREEQADEHQRDSDVVCVFFCISVYVTFSKVYKLCQKAWWLLNCLHP